MQKINEMMIHYLELIDYPEDSFYCCENPKVLCIDGIVLSVENDELKSNVEPEPFINRDTLKTRFSSRNYRQIVQFDYLEDRDIIRSFCGEDGI